LVEFGIKYNDVRGKSCINKSMSVNNSTHKLMKMTANFSAENAPHISDTGLNFLVPMANLPGDRGFAAPPSHELFRFLFSDQLNPPISENTVHVRLSPDNAETVEEVWLTRSNTHTESIGQLRITECQDFLFSHYHCQIQADGDIRAQTRNIYGEILTSARERGYPYLVRAWNFLPEINSGKGDEERYRLFSLGRAEAFKMEGYSNNTFPAATAIGTNKGTDFQIALLSGIQPIKMAENPRQTSAYNYPRQYGPAGPSFARASILNGSSGKQLLVSGTASIVGSESLHAHDENQQLEETLTNIHTIAKNYGWDEQIVHKNYSPLFRVYKRSNKMDSNLITSKLLEKFGNKIRVSVLHGEICRSELKVEIECIFWLE
jgi:chorismate lyase/3-hydroxybenzoate synthase